MINKNDMRLQIMYFGISLFSCICIMTNYNIIMCSNIVSIICLFDLYFIRNKDMIIHHVLVLCIMYYINKYIDIENKYKIAHILLNTEISTLFLTINNLLNITTNRNDIIIFKNINKLLFVTSFIYYRFYNYLYYLILDKNIYNIFIFYSKNNLEFYKITFGIYGLFILNLYWCSIIIYKIGEKVYKVKIKHNICNNP